MNKFVINYTYGVANFFTEKKDHKEVMREFYRCAMSCFGIRKSVSDPVIKKEYLDIELPLNFRDQGGNVVLTFSGDAYLFDMEHETHSGEPWKLATGNNEWCSCKERGEEELSCSVHHFWVPDHDDICECMKRGKAS